MTEFSTIHQRLFLSRNFLLLACVRSLLREGGGDGFLGIAKSAPGTGCCWLCNMNVEEDRRGGVRKTVCAARREKRRETSARCPVKSQGVVVVLVPYYDSQCFSWPLRNFSFFSFFSFSSFIIFDIRVYIYIHIIQLDAKVTSFNWRISRSLRPNLFSRPRKKLHKNES